MTKKLLFSFLIHYFYIQELQACSSFFINGHQSYLGKSYDWHIGSGHLFVNKQNMLKTSLISSLFEIPKSWVSQYGSLTFNQFGREMPHGGINEQGLSVELLWLSESEYPENKLTQKMNELQWIQYHLDTVETIDELIESAKKVSVNNSYAKVHYFTCDRFGDCAVLEYLQGKVVISKNTIYKAITNSSVIKSFDYLKNFLGFGGDQEIPQSSTSLDRFVRLAHSLKNIDTNSSSDNAFAVLQNVRQENYTRWNIVYNLGERSVEFLTTDNLEKSKVELSKFDFSCKTSVSYHDVVEHTPGDISANFLPYSRIENEKNIKRSLAAVPNGPSESQIEFLAKILSYYPETNRCLEL